MTHPARPPFAHYRDLLSAVGFRPSRKLGQNFLLDPTLHASIVEAAGVQPDDLILEVGAGLGFLTRELVAAGARVMAVEVDRRLFGILERERALWGEAGSKARLCSMDALERGRWNPQLLSLLEAELGGTRDRWLLVANLPYSVSGPLLGGMTQLGVPPAGGAVMVQEEVGRRITAEPDTAEYGALSVALQACYHVRLARRVGREVFWPRPGVGSAVVAMVRRDDSSLLARSPEERQGFSRFVRGLFGQRRKKLGNALPAALRAAGGLTAEMPAGLRDRRPGTLTWEQILEIWTLALGSP